MSNVNQKFNHRVGVDFHVFDGKFQGSRSHLLGIYRELLDVCREFEFVFFLDDIEVLRKEPGFDRPNATFVRMRTAGPIRRLLWDLPLLRKKHRLSVLHTQYIMPFWGSGNAVTIHDILFENFPEFFTPAFVVRSRLLMRWSARSCDLLFTVSEFSKSEIALRYGVEGEKIGVACNAVDTSVFYPGTAGSELIKARGLKPGHYILTVGRIEPRKNHATLLKAFAKISFPIPLVIVGQRDFGYHEFESALKALPSSHRVHLITDIGDIELPALYRHATMFAYPSFAEGFGMPPLEAMASGVPVITSNSTAIPEIVGACGLLIDPKSDLELANALERLLTDEQLRAELIEKGLLRAKQFRWRESAEVMAQALNVFLNIR